MQTVSPAPELLNTNLGKGKAWSVHVPEALWVILVSSTAGSVLVH